MRPQRGKGLCSLKHSRFLNVSMNCNIQEAKNLIYKERHENALTKSVNNLILYNGHFIITFTGSYSINA